MGLARDRRLPLCSGLMELIRRRVWRSAPSIECCDSDEMDLRRLLLVMSPPRSDAFPSSMRLGDRDRDGERFVDMVDMESESDADDSDLERAPAFLRRSSSFSARILSARPFLRTRSLGTSSVSFGFSDGFRSCCVREGRDLYGRSCAETVHS